MVALGLGAAQLAVLLLLAPLVQGLIQHLKARLQGRHGPGLLQPYFTLAKLWGRQAVRPEASGTIFRLAPRAALAIVLAAGLIVPLVWLPAPLAAFGDFIAVVGLLALERFVLGLAALDSGTPFGGLGSSRESTLGALIEPALFALALPWIALAGSTAWPALLMASSAASPTSVVRFFGLAAGLIVLLAETGRLPVDNPDTHLELTMIHEAMVLEASGPDLALLSLAQMVKQLVALALVADLLLPWALVDLPPPLQPVAALVQLLALGALLALAESLSAKLRFFRLPAYIGAATALSSAAAVLQVWGVR
jgi:formate hydrogenlyase subunit 4